VSVHPDTPQHVVTSTDDAAELLRRLTRAGWPVREGFHRPAAGVVLYGRVADLDTAHQALRAAAHGAGIVAVAEPAGEASRTLLAGLHRLEPASAADPVDRLVPEQRALLERLAAGDTIAAAAAAEFLSLRTANRRIAEARTVLGVRTTRDAVLVYLRQRRRP
jgi:DNA-binding NarL/FixJ family response regulator